MKKMKMDGGKINYFQGGIYLAQLNPNKGFEIGKLRPVIILTNQILLNTAPPILFICPLSSKSFGVSKYLHMQITERDALKCDSYALIEQSRAITIERIKSNRLGQLTPEELTHFKKLFNIFID